MLKSYVYLRNRADRIKDEGATAVEYGLLVALIAAVIVTIVATLGGQIATAFQTVVDELPGAPAAPAT